MSERREERHGSHSYEANKRSCGESMKGSTGFARLSFLRFLTGWGQLVKIHSPLMLIL